MVGDNIKQTKMQILHIGKTGKEELERADMSAEHLVGLGWVFRCKDRKAI